MSDSPSPARQDWPNDSARNDAAVESWLREHYQHPIALRQGQRDRLALALNSTERFTRFNGAIAAMLDISESRAVQLLNSIDRGMEFREELMTGLSACWVDGGPATRNCIRGFVRASAGLQFPEHRHLGREDILILQGGMLLDTGEVARPGANLVALPGTSHSFSAQDGGPDLLYFAVVHQGITVGDRAILHRDPGE